MVSGNDDTNVDGTAHIRRTRESQRRRVQSQSLGQCRSMRRKSAPCSRRRAPAARDTTHPSGTAKGRRAPRRTAAAAAATGGTLRTAMRAARPKILTQNTHALRVRKGVHRTRATSLTHTTTDETCSTSVTAEIFLCIPIQPSCGLHCCRSLAPANGGMANAPVVTSPASLHLNTAIVHIGALMEVVCIRDSLVISSCCVGITTK